MPRSSKSNKSVGLKDVLNGQIIDHISQNSSLTINLCDDPPSIDSEDDDYEMDSEELALLAEFRENVVKYVTIDNLILTKKNELKIIEAKNKEITNVHKNNIRELAKSKEPYEKNILEYLNKLGEDTVDLSDGRLRKIEREIKGRLTKDIVVSAIQKHIYDTLVVAEIMETMDKMLPRKKNISLKRT